MLCIVFGSRIEKYVFITIDSLYEIKQIKVSNKNHTSSTQDLLYTWLGNQMCTNYQHEWQINYLKIFQ